MNRLSLGCVGVVAVVVVVVVVVETVLYFVWCELVSQSES
jgi:hypothetical protein